ncbi:hypothetical protein Tco_1522529 [Tanacetum coccineum]
MENLEFCDKHNMVAYLKKPTRSEGFQEIVDFLNGSHIRISLITEASVRRHLQLADVDSISVLPNTKIFEQLSLMRTSEPILNVPDEAFVYEKWDDRVERATTTTASLDAEQTSEEWQFVLEVVGISTASRFFSTAEESVSTVGASMPVSTAGMVQEVNIGIPSPVIVKDKGKGKMEDSEDEQSKRTKLQQEQERVGHEAAVRL